MKAFKALLVLATTLSMAVACEKRNNNNGDEPEVPGPGPGPAYTQLNGSWTMAEDGMMRYFISIDCDVKESYIQIRELREAVHFYNNVVYGAGEMDGDPIGYAKCSVSADQIVIPIHSDGQPEEGRWEDVPEIFTREGNTLKATWSLSGKVLTIAGEELDKIERFEEAPYATISTTIEDDAVTIGAAETMVKIPFSVAPSLPWCTVTAIRDRSMLLANATITLDEEEVSVSIPAGTEDGYGVVSLQAEGANNLNVTITRKIGRVIVPSSTEVTKDYKGTNYGDITFTIVNPSSSYAPGVKVDEGGSSWMSAYYSTESTNNYRIQYYLEENDSGADRSAKIIISYTDQYGSGEPADEVEITVTQTFDAPALILNPASAQVSFLEQEVSSSITVTNPREGTWLEAFSEQDWISNCDVYPVEGNQHALRFNVSLNDSGASRSGAVTVRYMNYSNVELGKSTFTLTQGNVEPIITLDPEEMEADFHSNYDLSFRYRIDYGSDTETITADVDWLHPTSHEWNSDGETKTAYFFIMTDNLTLEPRVGHIRVTDGSVWKELTVTQTGIQSKIVVEKDEFTFDYNSATPGIPYRILDDSINWQNIQGASNVDWMHPNRPYHDNYSIHIDDNNSGATREGILTLTCGSEVSRVKIIQTYTAPEIHIENPDVSYNYTQQSEQFVHCVIAWSRIWDDPSYESNADWVHTMAVTNGVRLSLDENKTNITRSAVVTVHYLDVTATINVTQGIREWFDFGLGFQIASCNVGATSGEQAGTYAKWADAPSKITNGGRLPTNKQWYDFARAFTWKWEARKGVNGCVGTPNNEAYAGYEYFIPASGYYSTSGTLQYFGSHGYYWTSDNDTSFSQTAWVAVCSDELYRKVDTGTYLNVMNRATIRAIK